MNYNLVINSKFNPLTFQEMLYPFERYGEAYRAQEEALAELGTKASVWDNMVNSDTDSTSYNLINTYNTDLAAQRDALAKQGLDVNSRRKLLELRMRYGKEVEAVEKAYNAREEVRKLQEQAYINSGGNTRFSTYANQQSIDEYLNGQRPDYYTANLTNIAADTANQAKSIASRYINNNLINNGPFYDQMQTQGITAENADQILANLFNENTEGTNSQEDTNTANPLPGFSDLRNMVNDIRNKVGYKNFNSNDQAAIDAAIASGVRTGLGYEEKHNLVSNPAFMTDEQRQYQQLQMEATKLQIAKEASEMGYSINNDGTVNYSSGTSDNTQPSDGEAPEVYSAFAANTRNSSPDYTDDSTNDTASSLEKLIGDPEEFNNYEVLTNARNMVGIGKNIQEAVNTILTNHSVSGDVNRSNYLILEYDMLWPADNQYIIVDKKTLKAELAKKINETKDDANLHGQYMNLYKKFLGEKYN